MTPMQQRDYESFGTIIVVVLFVAFLAAVFAWRDIDREKACIRAGGRMIWSDPPKCNLPPPERK